MSEEYSREALNDIAQDAERDLNSHQAKQGHNNSSDSVGESGVDEVIDAKFPGATVKVGSAASGAGGNRDIPPEEGGTMDARGRLSKARDFEGEGGPEDKAQAYAAENPGNDDVRENVRN